MLYTFAKSHYDTADLHAVLEQVKPQDAIVLWQDGVLQAVKNPELFANFNTFVLKNDLAARGLSTSLNTISLAEFVALSEQYFPQLAL
ncbi:sulfurtransferase complex subunit TusB [Glaesserella sp.]|uniref:sulfurtransferase complex subunit TusB n=1 Tax=Glaesserella sp. TaxID=2094731 RepID=UPI0035A05842